jgi:hypothetical protein
MAGSCSRFRIAVLSGKPVAAVETDDEGLAAGDAEVLGQFLSFPSGRRVG